jgi:putative peptidoglycan lipid II flippase
VVFPLISRHAARGDMDQLGVAYRKGMRLILMINIPAAVGLVLLAEPVIRLFFQHGKFHAADTRLMMPVLMVYALGLPFFSFVNLVLRAFYAQKDTTTPVRAALLSFVVNLGLSIALMAPLSTVGLAVAGNVAIVVQAWYLQVKLARKTPQLAVHHLLGDLGKIAIASMAMGLFVGAGWWTTAHYFVQSKLTDGCAVAALVAVGILLYGSVLWLLRIEGREEFTALLERFVGRRPRASA